MKQKMLVTMDIYPGGGVKVLKVTDTMGRSLSKAKCQKTALDVGAEFGALKPGTEKCLVGNASKASVSVAAT